MLLFPLLDPSRAHSLVVCGGAVKKNNKFALLLSMGCISAVCAAVDVCGVGVGRAAADWAAVEAEAVERAEREPMGQRSPRYPPN